LGRKILETLISWLSANAATIGVIIPLITLAGSAVAYIIKMFLDLADRRRAHFLELIGFLDQPGTLAAKLAAVYQLSQYKQHHDFLLRFFDNRDRIISGESADVLKEEMRIATEYLRSKPPAPS
jgi:hypothetical protein